MDRQRFRKLFLRQFTLLMIVSLGLTTVLYVAHDIAPQPPLRWAEFALLDVVALLAASALSARLKLLQEGQRRRNSPKPPV